MLDVAIMWDWLSFAVRWLHVITAIAWIGSSFYFVALDLGLRKVPHLPAGAHGEEWQVHGGGFYHIQKFTVAPENMPEHLIWHKWQSYITWVSGAALLMIVYWVGGELYLLDPTKADLTLWQGILISGGSLTIGWLIYDTLCKSPLDHVQVCQASREPGRSHPRAHVGQITRRVVHAKRVISVTQMTPASVPLVGHQRYVSGDFGAGDR